MYTKYLRIHNITDKPFATVVHFDGNGQYGNHTNYYFNVTNSSKKRLADLAKRKGRIFFVTDDLGVSLEVPRVIRE